MCLERGVGVHEHERHSLGGHKRYCISGVLEEHVVQGMIAGWKPSAAQAGKRCSIRSSWFVKQAGKVASSTSELRQEASGEVYLGLVLHRQAGQQASLQLPGKHRPHMRVRSRATGPAGESQQGRISGSVNTEGPSQYRPSEEPRAAKTLDLHARACQHAQRSKSHMDGQAQACQAPAPLLTAAMALLRTLWACPVQGPAGRRSRGCHSAGGTAAGTARGWPLPSQAAPPRLQMRCLPACAAAPPGRYRAARCWYARSLASAAGSAAAPASQEA